MLEYDLTTEEGIALMCLAEALLRIPDQENIDKLIKDKLSSADWDARAGKSSSFFVNAATWGLMLTGKILSSDSTSASGLNKVFKKMLERAGEPVIRTAVKQAMRILGKQFVMGQTITEAIERAEKYEQKGYRFSYDMLGEGAKTAEDAERYFQAYIAAIQVTGKAAKHANFIDNPGISVKLSALYPRYEFTKYAQAVPAIGQKLLKLAQLCKEKNISLIVDAEEAERLDLSLDIIEYVFSHPSLDNWNGLGLAVQAYQKRAWFVLDWLIEVAQKHNKRWLIRLIKGAYWDSEIKLSQERGLDGYPVFTRKTSTDISFMACAQKIFANISHFYPMFATHNAHSVAYIFELAREYRDFEFQCLHGMGATLYDQIVTKTTFAQPCRVYAPVGSHEDLLPYLVRRLLENGANSSFVNRISDLNLPITEIVADPQHKLATLDSIANPKIPLPTHLFKDRKNSPGMDLTNALIIQKISKKIADAWHYDWHAFPSCVNKSKQNIEGIAVLDPNNHDRIVGWVHEADEQDISTAIEEVSAAYATWHKVSLDERASILEKMADKLGQHYEECIALLIREAGKTLSDAVSEVREAMDFCNYYAALARQALSPVLLPGPTGEKNQLIYEGRGPFLSISPWNFPLAIFMGQIAAALVSGNTVIAKPAEQTPLIACLAVRLFHEAGIPKNVLILLPGPGETVGAKLVSDLRIKGIMFTGSTEIAQIIQKTLANRGGPLIPFVAETGGQNAMLVDSSALPEQVVHDVIQSAFYSAGQRCSALRVLYVQENVADKIIKMLKGAMQELRVSDTSYLSTDIGPVIDKNALEQLQRHADVMNKEAELIYQVQLSEDAQKGYFFAPRVYEIKAISQLKREVFGPVLHIIRYKSKDLDRVISDINGTGYGLTFGIHSRIEETINYVVANIKVGNCYVNRNMIGAVVGVQPFGGEGLSGTGPKAGGPNYLYRLSSEKTICINTTAAGGNASLMTLGE